MRVVAFPTYTSVSKFPTIFLYFPSISFEFSYSCHVRDERLDPFAMFRPSRILTAGKTEVECKSGLFICKSIFTQFLKYFPRRMPMVGSPGVSYSREKRLEFRFDRSGCVFKVVNASILSKVVPKILVFI